VQVFFAPISASLAYIRAGRLRALAVTTVARADALPDIPTVADFVPTFEVSGWFGVGAPKDVPAAIVDRLNTEINAGLNDPAMKARLADLGASAFVLSPSNFGRFIADEIKKWANVINFANIKPK
jgi:tripartite-type tricarboxylate transporter receptor subunit TctC